MNRPLGTNDPFRDLETWDEHTARFWMEALEQRAVAADQRRLRTRLIQLAGIQTGDTVIEVGCGTGALLADLTRAVRPGGHAIGIEPQPVFAEATRQRLLREGLASAAEVRTARAEHLDLLNAQATACLAQTVFIHLPADALQQTLAAMVRAVRHGGRVLSVDQDGDSWVIDHPERELTRRIARFNSDQRYADGWRGRQLRRLFLETGLVHVEVHCWVHSDTDASSYLFGMAERLALAASEAGVVDREEAIRWIDDLRDLAAQGHFFSSINYYACVGVRA